MQHPDLIRIYKDFGEYKTNLAAKRFQLAATLEEVKEEWKNLETRDLDNINKKQDHANRQLSDSKYWEKKGQLAKAKECEGTYKLLMAELIQLVHELRMRKESLLPQYLLRITIAESQFYKAAADYADFVEKNIREIGQVQPVIFAGVPGYTNIAVTEEIPQQTFTPQQSFTPTPNSGPPPRPPQSGSSLRARGLFQFDAQFPQELSFRVGDILNILENNGDWWKAELNGTMGLVPSNYVELLR